MTPKEKYDSSETWQEKIIVMNLFHQLKLADGEWSLRKTAMYFGVSIGLVSENVKIGNSLDKVKNFEYRNDAIKFLRK